MASIHGAESAFTHQAIDSELRVEDLADDPERVGRLIQHGHMGARFFSVIELLAAGVEGQPEPDRQPVPLGGLREDGVVFQERPSRGVGA